MVDIIITAILVVMIGAAVRYLVKARQSGAPCIGCPAGCSCSQKSNGTSSACGCGCHADEK